MGPRWGQAWADALVRARPPGRALACVVNSHDPKPASHPAETSPIPPAAVAPALCELFDLPYTGSDALTLAITLDKAIARRVVSPELRVARGVLLRSEADETSLDELRYPVLVKPNDEGWCKGIRQD